MLKLESGVAPNEREVTGKVIDGEAIIIKFSDGMYYSMDGVGAAIWEMIAGRPSLQAMIEGVMERYDVAPATARTDVGKLIDQLLDEGLIVLEDDGAPSLEAPASGAAKQTYEAPKLNIYRDMADLLALDPPAPTLMDMPWKPEK